MFATVGRPGRRLTGNFSQGSAVTQIKVVRTIGAPAEVVFRTVADIREFSKVLPHVVQFEFLSDITSGVGTQFRETRLMSGREATTELEIVEYVQNQRVRFVAESHGTVWDTTFAVAPEGDHTKLTMVMDAKANRLLSRLMNMLIKGMVTKAVEKDLDLVKAFCEQ